MLVDDAVDKLNALLPLAGRQQELPAALREVHRRILRAFAETGKAPQDIDRNAASALAAVDLIVLDEDGVITGAYPFTVEQTDHVVHLDEVAAHAMCSLDALAMGPMFGAETRTMSVCAQTGVPIVVAQRGNELIGSDPETPWIGIRWQQPCGPAASSLCREMVFLADGATAIAWRGDDLDSASLFPLPRAVEFAARFFVPLMAE